MTFCTRDGNMRILQMEHCLVMLFDCIRKQGESLCIMTLGAIGHYSIFCKLPVMIVLMAIGAFIMLKRIGIFCLMA